MNPNYILLRLVRHFLPETVTRFLLRRGWIIRPGLETREPAAAVERYREVLAARGDSLSGKRVLVFGYGGNFAVGAEILKAGARQVVLLDRFAPPDNRRNRQLLSAYPGIFRLEGERVLPATESIALVHDDVKSVADSDLPRFDLVVSSSVFEHLDDVPGLTATLAALTAPRGLHIHYVDLRDHYFKLPFEMLTFSELTWRRWLDPTSNLNRYRLRDYRRVFEENFAEVELTVLERDLEAFARACPRIRPEFLTGNDEQDSVTLIRIVAGRYTGNP